MRADLEYNSTDTCVSLSPHRRVGVEVGEWRGWVDGNPVDDAELWNSPVDMIESRPNSLQCDNKYHWTLLSFVCASTV